MALIAALGLCLPTGSEAEAKAARSRSAKHANKSAKRAGKRHRRAKKPRRAHKKKRSASRSRRHRLRRKRRRHHRKKGYYVCKRAKRRGKRRGRKRCRFVPHFKGHMVAARLLRTEPLARPSGKVSLYNVHFRKTVTVNIYDSDGDFDDAALARLDRNFRCWRTNNERAVDPRLYEMLSRIYDHFGGKRIELVSGFRFQRNESSRHFHGSAADIRVSGISTRALYDYARSLDLGGMGIGIYPKQGFIHLDYRAPGEPSYRWTDTSPPGSARISTWRE